MSPKSRRATWRFFWGGPMSDRNLERKRARPGRRLPAHRKKSRASIWASRLHEDVESLLILRQEHAGHLEGTHRPPGTYNLNPLAFTAYLVPTSAGDDRLASGGRQRAQHTIPEVAKKDASDQQRFLRCGPAATGDGVLSSSPSCG